MTQPKHNSDSLIVWSDNEELTWMARPDRGAVIVQFSFLVTMQEAKEVYDVGPFTEEERGNYYW